LAKAIFLTNEAQRHLGCVPASGSALQALLSERERQKRGTSNERFRRQRGHTKTELEQRNRLAPTP